MQECAYIPFIHLYVWLQPAALCQPTSGRIDVSLAAFGWIAIWPRTETLLSAKHRQPDWANWLKGEQVGILQTRAKTICGGVQGCKQRSLYLMSLEQTAKSTREGRTDGKSLCDKSLGCASQPDGSLNTQKSRSLQFPAKIRTINWEWGLIYGFRLSPYIVIIPVCPADFCFHILNVLNVSQLARAVQAWLAVMDI